MSNENKDYRIYHTAETKEFLADLDQKSKRIVRDNLKKIADNPYPGQGIGDKEKLVVGRTEMYRLHVGRTWTIFYKILEEEKQIRLIEITSIDEAHEKYGY